MKNPFLPLDIGKRLTENINALFQTQGSEILDAFAKFADNYRQELIRATRPFLEHIDKFAQEVETASVQIAGPVRAAGLWIPPSASLSFITVLRDLCIAGNSSPSEVRAFFVGRYHDDNHALLRSTVDGWNQDEHFEARKFVITSALQAHIAGDYVLSIPALLPVIEGVLAGIAGRSKRPGERMSDFAGGIIAEDYFEGMREASKDAILEFVTGSTLYGAVPKKYFDVERFSDWIKSRGFEEDQVLNRHAILHGVQLNYSSPENSLRAFLLLDALSMIESLKVLTKLH